MSKIKPSKYQWQPRTKRLRIQWYPGNAAGFHSPGMTRPNHR